MIQQPIQSSIQAAGPDKPVDDEVCPDDGSEASAAPGDPEETPGDGGKRSVHRHDVDIWARFRYNGRGYEVVLLDLSTTGCRFFDRHGRLETGTHLMLKIAGIGPFEAVVRWRQHGYVGVQFCTQMYDPVLAHIVTLSAQKS
jgi:hypothetical protein